MSCGLGLERVCAKWRPFVMSWHVMSCCHDKRQVSSAFTTYSFTWHLMGTSGALTSFSLPSLQFHQAIMNQICTFQRVHFNLFCMVLSWKYVWQSHGHRPILYTSFNHENICDIITVMVNVFILSKKLLDFTGFSGAPFWSIKHSELAFFDSIPSRDHTLV